MPFDGTTYSDEANAIIVLERMEAFFSRKGTWCRRTFADGRKRCILGAMAHVTDTKIGVADRDFIRTLHSQTLKYLAKAIDLNFRNTSDAMKTYRVITDYNDFAAADVRDILLVIRKAKRYAEHDLVGQVLPRRRKAA